MNYSKIEDLELRGINRADHPNYCDAFIASGFYDGVPLTEEQIDELNRDSNFVNAAVHNQLF